MRRASCRLPERAGGHPEVSVASILGRCSGSYRGCACRFFQKADAAGQIAKAGTASPRGKLAARSLALHCTCSLHCQSRHAWPTSIAARMSLPRRANGGAFLFSGGVKPPTLETDAALHPLNRVAHNSPRPRNVGCIRPRSGSLDCGGTPNSYSTGFRISVYFQGDRFDIAGAANFSFARTM